MKYKKNMKRMLKLDYAILILSIIALFIYTTLFVLITTNVRYFFLVCILYTLVCSFEAGNSIINHNRIMSIKKNSMSMINFKVVNKGRRKLKKVA